MNFDLVLFDIDGTLMNSEKSILEAVERAMHRMGFKADYKSKARPWIGTTLEKIFYELGITDELMHLARMKYREEYYQVMETLETPYSGVKSTIKKLSNLCKMSVVTNKGNHGALKALQLSGMDGYFDKIIGADGIEPKPAVQSFENLMEYYRNAGFIFEKERILMVGDSNTDMQYAKNCGIMAGFAEWGFFKISDIKVSTDFLIKKPTDILQLVESDKIVKIEMDHELDLHLYQFSEIESIVKNYIAQSRVKQYHTVRIIHGKGKGTAQKKVRELLSQEPDIEFYEAPFYLGGLGATMIQFHNH